MMKHQLILQTIRILYEYPPIGRAGTQDGEEVLNPTTAMGMESLKLDRWQTEKERMIWMKPILMIMVVVRVVIAKMVVVRVVIAKMVDGTSSDSQNGGGDPS